MSLWRGRNKERRQKNKLKLTLHHGMSSHDFYISKSFSKYGQTPLNAAT